MLERYGGPMTIEEYRKPSFFALEELQRNEHIEEWVSQEVGVIVWGRLVTCRGVSAEGVKTAVEKKTMPSKRAKTTESSGLRLATFFQSNRTKR